MQITQWTNQNLMQIQVTSVKHGEIHASTSGLVLASDWLRKWCDFFLTNHQVWWSKTKANATLYIHWQPLYSICSHNTSMQKTNLQKHNKQDYLAGQKLLTHLGIENKMLISVIETNLSQDIIHLFTDWFLIFTKHSQEPQYFNL